MRDHKTYQPNPQNSYETVLEEVTSQFKPRETVPELLSEFIKLLGKEKEEWDGVKAMRKCLDEFFMWKKFQKPNDDVATCKDFETFLFSLDRNVIVIQEPDCPSSSKTVSQDKPKAPNTLEEPHHPRSIKNVSPDLPNTLMGTDNPSTNKPLNPATNKKTLKVKIYMGTGWDTDFANLGRGSSPDLSVKLTIHGGNIQTSQVQKSSWKPSLKPIWGEEFEFSLFSLENDELVVKVSDHNDKFTGTVRLLVSTLKPGIHVIPLSRELGIPPTLAQLLITLNPQLSEPNCSPPPPCNTARLLMRFMWYSSGELFHL